MSDAELEKVENYKRLLQKAIESDDHQDIAEVLFDIKSEGFHERGIIDITEAENILFE